MKRSTERIALVTRDTRLRGLMRKFATKGQAAFRWRGARVAALARDGQFEEAAAAQVADQDEDFDELVGEDDAYQQSLGQLRRQLEFGPPVQEVDRSLLPAFDFAACLCVVVVGPDGLVANTAKYATDVPIIGVNPDPERIDGVLLPFMVDEARGTMLRVLKQQAPICGVTLAAAQLHDGQRMLAFNDLFIGASSHVSARYELTAPVDSRPTTEAQTSSGLLISTGAGSTGWMSSVYNMARGVASWLDSQRSPPTPPALPRDSKQLLWAVREPFRSQTSGVSLVAGRLSEGERLKVESQMADEGVIFSDGVEHDFLPFNGGAIANIGVAREQALLVERGGG